MPRSTDSPLSPREKPSSVFSGLRVVVLGARRVRNGTGPFLALQVDKLGAELAGVFGTRPVTAHHAASWLAAKGVVTEEYSDWDTMLSHASPHALIIASPLGTHRPWLELALAHEQHVLCEKPLLRGDSAGASNLATRFAASGLVLAENCQWPFVLPAFAALHPKTDLKQTTSFRMLLSPSTRGRVRWQEVLSHPLSLLQTVAPGPAEIVGIQYSEVSPDALDSRLNFRYKVFERELSCEIMLEDTGQKPRPAEFAFDDSLMVRRISDSNYRIGFAASHDQEAEVHGLDPDPMEARLHSFLTQVHSAIQGRSAPIDENLVRRQALFEQLVDAYEG